MAIRQLNHRENAGLKVTLVWDSETDKVQVICRGNEPDDNLDFEVADHSEAFLAFEHPYSFANNRHLVAS